MKPEGSKYHCDCVSEGKIKGGLIVGMYTKTSDDKAVVVNSSNESPIIWERPFAEVPNIPNGPRFNFI